MIYKTTILFTRGVTCNASLLSLPLLDYLLRSLPRSLRRTLFSSVWVPCRSSCNGKLGGGWATLSRRTITLPYLNTRKEVRSKTPLPNSNCDPILGSQQYLIWETPQRNSRYFQPYVLIIYTTYLREIPINKVNISNSIQPAIWFHQSHF